MSTVRDLAELRARVERGEGLTREEALALIAEQRMLLDDYRRDDAETIDEEVGEVALTPLMAWLRERGGAVESFHQSVVVEVPSEVDEATLTRAVAAVVARHGALRMRGRCPVGGAWALRVEPAAAVTGRRWVECVSVAGLDAAARRACERQAAAAAAARLDLAAGVGLQVVWFAGAPGERGRLLIVAHHLLVDGVSWRILVPELRAAWEAVRAGRAPALAAGGTSLREWSRRLAAEAQRAERTAELAYWQAQSAASGMLRPGAVLDPARDTVGTAQTLTRRLPAAVTRAVVSQVPAAYFAGVNDVLLAALAVALVTWRQAQAGGTPGAAVLIELESHGRLTDWCPDVDLSRTVGWFTSVAPQRLDLSGVDVAAAWAGGRALGQAVKAVKEQLRAVPDGGLGYGLLRYLNAATRPVLAAAAPAQLRFNYLGRLTLGAVGAWGLAADAEGLGGGIDAGMPLAACLNVNAVTLETPRGPELQAQWAWAPALVPAAAVEALAAGWFHVLAQLAAQPAGGGRTPSDLPLVALSQSEIDALERRVRRV